jgi:hypothetical protein
MNNSTRLTDRSVALNELKIYIQITRIDGLTCDEGYCYLSSSSDPEFPDTDAGRHKKSKISC